MTLIRTEKPRYNPFENMLGRFLDEDFFTDLRNEAHNLPAVNMAEKDEEYELELAVPGMKKSDFKIEVDNNMLTISAEKESKDKKEENGYFRREFNFSSFQRSFTLPEGKVDEDNIKAKYENGVLKVNIPKSKEALPTPPKMIDIK